MKKKQPKPIRAWVHRYPDGGISHHTYARKCVWDNFPVVIVPLATWRELTRKQKAKK